MKALLIALLTLSSLNAFAVSKFESSLQEYLAIASNETLATQYPHVLSGISPKQYNSNTTEYFVWLHSREKSEGRSQECVLVVEVSNVGTSQAPQFVVSGVDNNECQLQANLTDSKESWYQLAAVLRDQRLNKSFPFASRDLAIDLNRDSSQNYQFVTYTNDPAKLCVIEVTAKNQKVRGVDFSRCK